MTIAAVRRPDPVNKPIPEKDRNDRVARFRPHELDRLRDARGWQKGVPNDDSGIRFALRTLDTLALSGDVARPRAAYFLARYCGWMTPAARADAIDTAFSTRKLWSAEDLGNDLNVTAAEHSKARIKTFRVAGMTDADMKAKRKADDAARKREERLQERLAAKPTASRPALRVDAILNLLPKEGWWNVGAIVSQLERSKAIAFATLDKETGSLRPAVHRAIKHGVKEGRLQTRMVPGSKMDEAMQIRRGPRA